MCTQPLLMSVSGHGKFAHCHRWMHLRIDPPNLCRNGAKVVWNNCTLCLSTIVLHLLSYMLLPLMFCYPGVCEQSQSTVLLSVSKNQHHDHHTQGCLTVLLSQLVHLSCFLLQVPHLLALPLEVLRLVYNVAALFCAPLAMYLLCFCSA